MVDTAATPAEALAAAVANARPGDLPAGALRHSLMAFVNFVGCAIGGARHDAVDRAERAYLEKSVGGRSIVIGREGGYPLLVAALLNGIAGAVNAFDDTHSEATIHAGPPVGGALVALASAQDRSVRGDEFLTAYAWGLEIAVRLSKALSVTPAQADIGWSQTGIAAPVGVAAACARLLKLDAQHTLWAMGIAASLACGIRAAHGSMAMHLAPARAAAAGLEAALLAQQGFTGPEGGLDGKMGFFSLFSRKPAEEHLYAELGSRFELLDIMFKPYPCGIVIHGVVDACLALSWSDRLTAASVEELVLEVPEIAAQLAINAHPDNEFAAQVSLQHWAAAALLRRRAGIEEGTLAAILDPDIASVRAKCIVKPRHDLANDAAIVSLRFNGDCTRSVTIQHCLGSLANPLEEPGVSFKFIGQAAPVLGAEQAASLLERCWQLADEMDVASIWSATQLNMKVS